MCVLLSLLILGVLVTLTITKPFGLADGAGRLVERWAQRMLDRGSAASFEGPATRGRRMVFRMRTWAGVTAVAFPVLQILDGSLFGSYPDAVPTAAFDLLLAAGIGTVVVLAGVARAAAVAESRAALSLGNCGIRAVWMLGASAENGPFRQRLDEVCSEAEDVTIVDVTGHDLVGSGPGKAAGILYDLLAGRPDLPATVLLLKPDDGAIDPERQQATVFQSVLREIGVGRAAYMKRLDQTLRAIELLNREREPDTMIRVAYFREKPAIRGVFVGDVMFASPWKSREGTGPIPFLEVVRKSAAASFFEAFRLQFVRIGAEAEREAFVPIAVSRAVEVVDTEDAELVC